jgi:hypothetical protein
MILANKCEKTKDFDVRILAPANWDRVPGLYARKRAGAKVKVSPRINKYDFRFQVCDGEAMILNIPSPATAYMKSEVGYEIKAKKITDYCLKIFEEEWLECVSQDFDNFVEEGLCAYLPSLHGNEFAAPTIPFLSKKAALDPEICRYYLDRLVQQRRVVEQQNGFFLV